uniref:Cilia- and flagella-associated protein 52 n=1 Tax=Astatotilapia calliptera TaxID=8154 RepID=A0AAX7W009_ASTCA
SLIMDVETESIPRLELEAVIGFNGHVSSGLRVHPDNEHMIYPLGCTIILKRIKDGKQEFLHGHTNNVTCISVSKSGLYIASGQVNFMGFKATIIIWDYATRTIYTELVLHKAKVEALAFSPNDKYLVSLGGQDDGSIVVWNIETKQAICGSPASAQSAGHSLILQYSNTNDNIFVSAGSGTLRVWELDLPNRKIRPTECQTGKLKRTISEDDQFIFCGTMSGDIMKVNLKTKLLNHCGPAKSKYSMGVNVIKILKSGDLLVGCGSGTVTLSSGTNFKTLKKVDLEKAVTSIATLGDGNEFFVGTEAAQMYRFSYENFKVELISTSHNEAVKDVAILFGKLMLTIHNAHTMGATAIAGTRDCKRIVSGGGEGQVCVWELKPRSYRLLEAMKKHKAAVTCLKIKSDDTECVSASSDGTCIIWDIVRFVVRQMMIANTLFRTVCYHPEEFQIITSGTDRKVAYWDVFEGKSALRQLEASQSGAINGMHISQDGKYFVTGGDDKLVKVWDYMLGGVTHVGVGHGGSITSMKICSNSRNLVSTSADGAILCWKFPHVPSS